MTGQPVHRTPNDVLRDARLALSMSQDDLARALREAGWHGCDRRAVQRYESGEVRRPQYLARRTLSSVLKVPWDRLGFEPPERGPGEAVPGEDSWEGEDDVRRRTFALSVAVAGLAGGSGATAAAEQVRHELLRARDGTALVEEWEALRDEYAVRVVRLPPAMVLRSLLADLSHLNAALTAVEGNAAGALYRIGAQLTSVTAWTVGNLDLDLDAARWWRTSHQLASRSGDLDTRLWVTAQEVLMALYQSSVPVSAVRTRIESVRPMAEAVPASTAIAGLYCAEAQAAGMASDPATARRALQAVRETFAALPEAVSGDRDSFLGWPETRIDYTESFTYAHLGDYAAASAAQDRALAGFPASAVRDPVKVELQRALCMARTGAAADAEQHALHHLSRLEHPQHDLPISNLTGKVLRALPVGRATDETAQLTTYLEPAPMASLTT